MKYESRSIPRGFVIQWMGQRVNRTIRVQFPMCQVEQFQQSALLVAVYAWVQVYRITVLTSLIDWSKRTEVTSET